MQPRFLFFGLSLVCAVAVLVLAALNLQLVSICGANLPEGAVLLVSLIVGGAAGWTASGASLAAKSVKQEQITNQWAVQDAKLMAEVTSDKEKQLQAKIDTLEKALQTLMDKQKKK